MKNKGFTLIELLAVVTIISLLLVLVVPKITSQLNNSKDEVNSATKKIIYRAAEKYVQDYNINQEKYEDKEYCLTMKELIDENYLTNEITDNKLGINIKEKKTVRIIYDDISGFDYELVDSNECDDVLSYGLTPVTYKDDKWVVVSPMNKNNEWYDYDNQKWANAVTLLPGVKKEVGDEVAVDGTEASMMLVWIPRFEYKIEGTYGKGGADAEHPGEVEVNFISKDKTTPTEGYILHPAFTFGDQDVSGFWVGKFELSHETLSASTTANNLGCSSTSCTNASGLRILPNKASLRYNNVSNFFYGIKSIENTQTFGLNNMDTHMMKDSEWGAVAYLSQSKYGKYGNNDYEGAQKEVYINNSSSYYTGRSGGNPGGSTPINGTYTDQTSTTQYNNYGFYTYDGYLLSYNTNNKTETRDINKGAGASTTGNIYGVYDMSGGSWEYVMGVYIDAEGISSGYSTSLNSGFEGRTGSDNGVVPNGVVLPDIKYYDTYTNTTNSISNDGSESCNNGICYGHAMSETTSWYRDYANMVTSNFPWFVRGGYCFNNSSAGVFGRGYYAGNSDSDASARVVGFGK